MATYAELRDFGKNTNANIRKSGLYAIQPNKFTGEPPIKVGYGRNLLSRIGSYMNTFPQGVKIHMIGRVPARDDVYPTASRDDVVAAEKRMLDALKTPWLKRNEWFEPHRLDEIKKALGDAQRHFANTFSMQARLYDADEIKKLGSTQINGRRVFPPEYAEAKQTILTPMAPLPKKRRTGLSSKELAKGAAGATEQKRRRFSNKQNENQQKLDIYAERQHRSGENYKGTEQPAKRRRVSVKKEVGTLVDDAPVIRLKKKTKQ